MRVVAVAGFSSDAGKTTLACELLAALPGWEAVKVTKGHYRSCGKDPHACCVSHLLTDRPLVVSGREGTDVAGKDTGRYWAAGASNVHWVVATKDRVADGVREALSRVAPDAPGVVVEGTAFAREIPVDFMVLVAAAGQREMKASAASVAGAADALYVSGAPTAEDFERIAELARARRVEAPLPPLYLAADFARLVDAIGRARTTAPSLDTVSGDDSRDRTRFGR